MKVLNILKAKLVYFYLHIFIVQETTAKLCLECFAKIGKGLRHQCNKQNTMANLQELAYSHGPDSAEQLASTILKKKMVDEDIKPGTKFTLSTGGKPLTGM